MDFEQNLIKIFRHIREHLRFDDTCICIKNAIPNYQEFCSWEELEYVANTPNMCDLQIIGQNGKLIEFSKFKHTWRKDAKEHHKDIIESINEGNTLIVLRWEDFNLISRTFCKILDQNFDINSSAHVYSGLTSKSKSFITHADFPSNIILQIEGECHWKVYSNRQTLLHDIKINNKYSSNEENLKCVFNDILVPGDILYLPSRTYHAVKSMGKRISISFPCWPRYHDEPILDREYYKINF